MTTTTKMTLGILGGIGAGLCLGLLMAPDKGSTNRKKILDTASDWTKKLTHLFSGDGHMQLKHARHDGTGRTSNRVSHRAQPKRKP
jgi:gas vesicle protein